MMSMGSTSIPVSSLTSRMTAVADGLADVLRSAGDGVQVVVGAPDHQQPAVLVLHERGHRHDDVGRLRGVRVVVVVGARHVLPAYHVGGLADVPDGLEALGVGLEQVAAGQPAQVQHRCVSAVKPVDVGVDEHLVVEAVDRVVERGAVAAGSRCWARRPAAGTNASALRISRREVPLPMLLFLAAACDFAARPGRRAGGGPSRRSRPSARSVFDQHRVAPRGTCRRRPGPRCCSWPR